MDEGLVRSGQVSQRRLANDKSGLASCLFCGGFKAASAEYRDGVGTRQVHKNDISLRSHRVFTRHHEMRSAMRTHLVCGQLLAIHIQEPLPLPLLLRTPPDRIGHPARLTSLLTSLGLWCRASVDLCPVEIQAAGIG